VRCKRKHLWGKEKKSPRTKHQKENTNLGRHVVKLIEYYTRWSAQGKRLIVVAVVTATPGTAPPPLNNDFGAGLFAVPVKPPVHSRMASGNRIIFKVPNTFYWELAL